MAGDSIADIVQELKAEAKKEALPPKAEEVKVEEPVEEKVSEEAAETTEEEPIEEVVEAAPSLSERAQARIDALIERQIDKDKKIIELEKRLESFSGKQPGEPVYTKEQLLALIADDAQPSNVKAWATDKLTDIKVEERLGKFEQSTKLTAEVAGSYERAKEDFPDMSDPKSEMWQLANEIYLRKGLSKDPDGQYTAAALAKIELDKKGNDKPSAEILQKRLDKEAGKKSLATISKKVMITSEDVLAKLEKEAMGKRPSDPAWAKYLAAMEKDRLAKKKK